MTWQAGRVRYGRTWPLPRTQYFNGRPAMRHKIKASVDGIDVVFWTTYIEGKDHFYQVQAWTLAGMEAQNEKSLLKVSDSFKEN